MNAQFGAPFRLAGLSYLQYVGIASRTLRNCVKEPIRSKALTRENLFFNRVTPAGERTSVTSVLPASKSL